jgi:arsenate reductase (glutaredoxin)
MERLMPVTVYHNPACGTSRTVLEIIRSAGEEPQVIEYLKQPPSREELQAIIDRIGLPIRDIMRRTGSPYDELGLDNPKWTDAQLIDFMLEHPILINRPIVVTPTAARLCRPADSVRELLA